MLETKRNNEKVRVNNLDDNGNIMPTENVTK